MLSDLFRARALAVASGVLLLCTLAAPPADAQVLFGYDGGIGSVWEYPSVPGPPCGQPTNPPLPWAWAFFLAPCAVPPAPLLGTPPAPGGILGDVASNRLTDTVFVTDGVAISEHLGGGPFTGLPGTIINAFPIPAGLGLGPITGMCHDSGGVITGAPVLYITDGFLMAGLTPSAPGTCGPPALATPVVPVPAVGAPATDITIDPVTGTFWACRVGGFLTNFTPGGVFLGVVPVAGICGLGAAPLQGIAWDLASPGAPFIGAQPAGALYVTDGFVTAYLVPVPFGPAAPTFYSPFPCNPTPGPITGLAFKTGGITYGAPGPPFLPPGILLSSSGQASSPGPTHALTFLGTAATSSVWVVYGFNVFAPGYFCPPVYPFLATPLHVDFFTPPGGLLFLGPGGPAFSIPAAIPAGVPTGLGIFMQIFEDTSGAGVGPWKSSAAVGVNVSAP
jgi:hypothetical protein